MGDHIDLEIKHKPLLFYMNHSKARIKHLHFLISPKPHEISWSQSRLTCVRKNSAESSENGTEILKVAAAEAGTHSSPCWSSVWITFSKQIQKVKPLTGASGSSVPINIFLLFFLIFCGHPSGLGGVHSCCPSAAGAFLVMTLAPST